MTHSDVWHDSIADWSLTHMYDTTHSYVQIESFICATWLIHMCDVTHSYVRQDSLIYAPPPKSTKSRNSETQIPRYKFNYHSKISIWICTSRYRGIWISLVDFRDLNISGESVIQVVSKDVHEHSRRTSESMHTHARVCVCVWVRQSEWERESWREITAHTHTHTHTHLRIHARTHT